MGKTIDISVADGKYTGYLASPAAGKGPGVLVIQEIFGVNKVMRDICDAYAAQGYFALCPDIFWRQEPNVDITDQSQAEWDKAFSLYKGFDEAKGVQDLKAALAALRQVPGCNGKAGVTGYCLGGKLTYLMACRSDANAAAAYYGVGIDGALDEAKNIRNPTILHIAQKDGFVPKEAQDKIVAALKGHPHVAVHLYADNDHAFCRKGGQHYDEAACKLANGRTMELFKKALA
ncbi:MAG: dienelactone hydrolase family protein [Reyranellaceae bacterium]